MQWYRSRVKYPKETDKKRHLKPIIGFQLFRNNCFEIVSGEISECKE